MRFLHRPGDFENFVAGVTGTRAGRGKPLRWAEGWVAALRDNMGLDNETNSKAQTRERAVLVQIMLEHGRLHGRSVLA